VVTELKRHNQIFENSRCSNELALAYVTSFGLVCKVILLAKVPTLLHFDLLGRLLMARDSIELRA